MPTLQFDSKVREAFSKAALSYDQAAALQKQIGLKFLTQMEGSSAALQVLDIGTGTGWLTQKLVDKFPNAKTVGLDFAPGMLSCVQKNHVPCHLVQTDARMLPFKEDQFDIAFSNLVYQWMEDFPDAFQEVHRILKKWGAFYLSCFGEGTLKELTVALESSLDLKRRRKFNRQKLVSIKEIENAFKENSFRFVEVYSEKMTVPFADIFAIMEWLKNIGANGVSRNVFLGKDTLLKANDFYKSQFKYDGGVYATFEVIWAKAKK